MKELENILYFTYSKKNEKRENNWNFIIVYYLVKV